MTNSNIDPDSFFFTQELSKPLLRAIELQPISSIEELLGFAASQLIAPNRSEIIIDCEDTKEFANLMMSCGKQGLLIWIDHCSFVLDIKYKAKSKGKTKGFRK